MYGLSHDLPPVQCSSKFPRQDEPAPRKTRSSTLLTYVWQNLVGELVGVTVGVCDGVCVGV